MEMGAAQQCVMVAGRSQELREAQTKEPMRVMRDLE